MPRPIQFDDRQINRELLVATTSGDLPPVLQKLAQGANPNGTVPNPNGHRNTLMNALIIGYPNILKALLEHTEKPGQQIIDPSQDDPTEDPNNPEPYSMIQAAFSIANRECWVLFYDYFVKHFPHKSFASVINKRFSIRYDGGIYRSTTIGHVLLNTISTHLISHNNRLLKANKEERAIDTAFGYWLAHNEPNKNPPDEIRYFSPVAAFDFLVSKGLDVLAADFRGTSVLDLAKAVDRAYKDPNLWETEIRPVSQFIGITQTAPAYANGKGGICVPIKIRNFGDIHPFDTILIPSASALVKRLQAAAAIQTAAPAPKVLELEKRVDVIEVKTDENTARIKALEEAVTKIFAKLASYTEEQYNETVGQLVAYPTFLGIFYWLHQNIESEVRQRRDATRNIFATKPSSDKLVAAQGALTLFSIAANLCPVPFVAIIPGIAQMLVNVGILMDTARKNKAVFNATLGMKPEHLATILAARLTAEAMLTYGMNYAVSSTKELEGIAKGIFGHVQKRITSMGTMEFVDPGHVYGFLIEDAINKLHADRSSSESLPSDPYVPRLALVDALPTRAPTLVKSLPPAPAAPKKFTPACDLDAQRRASQKVVATTTPAAKKKSGGLCVVM